jgi:hypothetical protein
MGNRSKPVGMIGSNIAAGLRLWIICDVRGCGNTKIADLEALRLELGPRTIALPIF